MDIKENNKTKTTPAQLKAINKYSQKHYKTVGCRVKISEYEQIKADAEANNLTSSKMLLLCYKYCIDNNIDISKLK